jgi:hypothetical protein
MRTRMLRRTWIDVRSGGTATVGLYKHYGRPHASRWAGPEVGGYEPPTADCRLDGTVPLAVGGLVTSSPTFSRKFEPEEPSR